MNRLPASEAASAETSLHASLFQGEGASPQVTSSALASPSRAKGKRSVRFDPSLPGSKSGLPCIKELNFDEHAIEHPIGDGFDREHRQHRGGSAGAGDDVQLSLFSPFAGHASVEHEEPPSFQLTRDDVAAAFEFLDVNGTGVLTMANLKNRLSAFFPQLTSKEYKFLVEDPSGSTGGSSNAATGKAVSSAPHCSAPAAETGNHVAAALLSPLRSPSQSGNPSFAGADIASMNLVVAAEGNQSGGRLPNTRAGVDIDQLWDLINSFQQFQRSICNTSMASPSGARQLSVHAPTNTSFNASLDSYLMNPSASHGGGSSEATFDAVGEAFRIYDPHSTHYVEEEVLSRIMARVGFGELSEEELAVLVSTADFDGDGRISLDDFRRLVNMKGRFKK